MTSYKNLEVWKKAMLLVRDVYTLLAKYPKEEMYGLTQQTKKAAVSIAANIAEGIGRNYKKDTIQFLHISRGSLYELETLLSIAVMINILLKEDLALISAKIEECNKMLNGLISYYENSMLK